MVSLRRPLSSGERGPAVQASWKYAVRRTIITYYDGFDVSLKEVSNCVIDDEGEVVAQGTAPADPEGVAGWFKNRSLTPKRIVHESGQLSIWLQRGMTQVGIPAICIDARKAHKSESVLSARFKKSDKADAEGLAQLARMNWFTPVHIRSEKSDRLRALIGGRERMIRLRKDLEGHIRAVLKAFGTRMTGVGQA